MKKLFKLVFNRTFVVLLFLLLQILLLVAGIVLLYVFYNNLIVQIIYILLGLVVVILQLVIVIFINYKQKEAEYKLPWAIMILLLPYLGPILFLIFYPRDVNKRNKELLNNISKNIEKYFPKQENNKNLGIGKKTFTYLENLTKTSYSKFNRTIFYKNGETFFPEFINELKKAKEFIFMEFFIIADGKWWSQIHDVLVEKAKNGVEVRLLYDDIGCFGKVRGNYISILRKEGINAYKFNKCGILLTSLYNNRDHRKIAIIDHSCAFTGGINLGDEYANVPKASKFGYWKDTMIKISGSSINNLIALFLTNWDLTTQKLSDYDKYMDYLYEQYDDLGYVFPFGHGPKPFYEERVGEDVILNIINSAKKSIYISSPYLIPSEYLLNAIEKAALNGVEVNFFIPGIPDKKLVYFMAKSYFEELNKTGVNIYIYKPGFNHEKLVMADDKLAFIGTINFDYRSLVHHFECGAVLYNCNCLKEVKADFLDMALVSELVPKDYVFTKGKKFLSSIIKIISPLL